MRALWDAEMPYSSWIAFACGGVYHGSGRVPDNVSTTVSSDINDVVRAVWAYHHVGSALRIGVPQRNLPVFFEFRGGISIVGIPVVSRAEVGA